MKDTSSAVGLAVVEDSLHVHTACHVSMLSLTGTPRELAFLNSELHAHIVALRPSHEANAGLALNIKLKKV